MWNATPSFAAYDQNINAYIMIYSDHFYYSHQGNLDRGITSFCYMKLILKEGFTVTSIRIVKHSQ